MEEKKPLTILRLEASNFANLKAIRITPDGKPIILTGKNEAGKSSVLNLIQSILEGMKVNIPIRRGEDRAEGIIDLGDIKIRKLWTEKGETLEVWSEAEDGKKQKYTSPQTLLNELTGKMVDPMILYQQMKSDPKKFRDSLAKLVGLSLDDLKNEESKIRDERKLINDKIRDAVAHLNEMTAPSPETPNEEILFKNALDDLSRLNDKFRTHEKYRLAVKDVEGRIERRQGKILELSNEIERLNKEQIAESAILETMIEPELVPATRIIEAQDEIEKIEQRNSDIRRAKRYREAVKSAEKYKKESDLLSQKIERIHQDIQLRVANCKFPVDGLSLTDDNVIYDGLPVASASSSRQIRIFTKMAMAMNQTIKVLLVRDGSLLDDDALKEMCAIAEAEGYQIWIEKVDSSGKVGIYIEDGEIKNEK